MMARSIVGYQHTILFALLGLFAAGCGSNLGPTNHKRWTVKQVECYWQDRGTKVLVQRQDPADAQAATPHAATDAERDGKKFYVKNNVSMPVSSAPIVVELEPVDAKTKVALIPKAGSLRLKGWLNTLADGSEYTLAEVLSELPNQVLLRRKYTQLDFWYTPKWDEHWTEFNHDNFAAGDPVYEGGTVGVVIDGTEYIYAVLAGLGAVAVFLVGWRLRIRAKRR